MKSSLFNGLEEAVRIDIDADSDFRAPFHAGQPVADDILNVEASPGVDKQPLAMAAAEHGERSRRGAEHDHPFD